MSNSLVKKFDKIVSKLAINKSKDIKLNENDLNDYYCHHDDIPTDGNEESQRMKYNLENTTKIENSQHLEGISSNHIIRDNLKDSPLK
ncbi:unnamed protein product, partial [Rotaria sp. Silwood1]